ncbi:hypothetical protein PGT21_021605 [Puccinia graminis f. sp. tritici]|uniref:EIF3F/CSN6-like C-terminal domain-containing protein n=1 Tax=Puccinia graminis f. sp. tritici TaxID=56615 RepID=A0A5B0MDR2_PUCGR|nr:hypothetical protein PGT21_021605 [Puccinia graminis f. sp. tritici]
MRDRKLINGSAHGTIYVTNQRILFITHNASALADLDPPTLQPLSSQSNPSILLPPIKTLTIPLRNSFDGRFVQPWLSTNYHLSTFVPVPNGNLDHLFPSSSSANNLHSAMDSFTLKAVFNEGHGFEFTEALEEVKNIMFQSDSERPAELEELPTYSPPTSAPIGLVPEPEAPSVGQVEGQTRNPMGSTTTTGEELPPSINDDFHPRLFDCRNTLPEADLLLAASVATEEELHERLAVSQDPPLPPSESSISQQMSQIWISAFFGALIGTQIGKKIEIVNCFEILTDSDGKVNNGFLKTRREQYLLGWYTNRPEPREKDLAILNEVGSTTAKELSVQIYELTQATTGADGEGFVKCPFDVQTSESERITVDCVAKPDVGSNESGQAIHMLHNKLGSIVDYLAQLMADLESANPTTTTTAKIDHGLLPEISSLPKPDENASFKKEYMTESNNALLTSYLSSQSKVLTETNPVKHFLLNFSSLVPVPNIIST